MKWLGILVLFVAFSARAQSMKAGLWKAHSEFQVVGIPLPSSDDEQCVSKSQAKDVKRTLSAELAKKGCAITQWKLKNHKLEAALDCKNKDLKAKGTMKGTVTAEKYELFGEAEGSFKGLPTSATLRLTGTWTASCRP
jgi:hypothetical protein